MARPNQEAVETFVSITGLPEAVALQKLEEHGGNLNQAVNAYFSEGDRNLTTGSHNSSTAFPQEDFMDIDDQHDADIHRIPSLPALAPNLNPFSLLDSTIGRGMFGTPLDPAVQAPIVTHPREVREIPIEDKDGNQSTTQSGRVPSIEDVTGTVDTHGPDIHGTVIINDEDDDNAPPAQIAHRHEQNDKILADTSLNSSARPSAPESENLPDYGNEIEEEMLRAAIEASKREAEENYRNQKLGRQTDSSESGSQSRQSYLEDPELAHAVSLSLKTAEQEKAWRVQGGDSESAPAGPSKSSEAGLGEVASNGRLQAGSLSFHDEAEDVEEQPLVRNRSRHMSSGSTGSVKDVEFAEASTLPSTAPQETSNPPNRNSFPSEEWGGISSEEHDEAVMLEAAMFGGIPEGTGYQYAYAPHEFMQGRGSNPRAPYRPPSPSLAAQRLIREQQDDEYLASLQADRERELKEAEAAREEERRIAEESRRKLLEEHNGWDCPSVIGESGAHRQHNKQDPLKGARLGQEQDRMYILFLQEEVVGREESGEDSREKGNHTRKGRNLALETLAGVVSPLSPSSTQDRWYEEEKAIPLKKRRGALEENNAAATHSKKMKAKMKTKMNKKCSSRNEDSTEEEDEEEKGEETKVDDVNVNVSVSKKRVRGSALMEGSRCSRVNGRGWRCCQQTLVGYSLCEHHLGKGRLRSMTSVRSRSIASTAPKKVHINHPSSSSSSSLEKQNTSVAEPFGEEEEEKKPEIITKKRMKLGVVKARSISSLLGQTNTQITAIAHENSK